MKGYPATGARSFYFGVCIPDSLVWLWKTSIADAWREGVRATCKTYEVGPIDCVDRD